MEIKEVKELVRKTEMDILIIIGKFERETGCKISSVKMFRNDEMEITSITSNIERVQIKVDFE